LTFPSTRLTPNIGLFLEPIRDEVEFAIRTEMPQADGESRTSARFGNHKPNLNVDWIEIDISDILLRFSARVSSRVFVGLPLCRNSSWLQLSMDTTVNTFGTAIILRMLPSFLHWLHPLIVRFGMDISRVFHFFVRTNLRVL
jgi:ent-kaurene oxidase